MLPVFNVEKKKTMKQKITEHILKKSFIVSGLTWFQKVYVYTRCYLRLGVLCDLLGLRNRKAL